MKGIWGALAALVVLVGCGGDPVAPTPVTVASPLPTCVLTVTGDGNVIIGVCGRDTTITPPSPSPAPGQGGDNTVAGFAIFCYGFGTPEGKPEPNHGACVLPAGYPEIAVTASPKDSKGVDIPSPGDQTDSKVIDWDFAVVPANAASLVVNGENRFNARVVPVSPRVAAAFTLTAHYTDPKGGKHDATKTGGVQ